MHHIGVDQIEGINIIRYMRQIKFFQNFYRDDLFEDNENNEICLQHSDCIPIKSVLNFVYKKNIIARQITKIFNMASMR